MKLIKYLLLFHFTLITQIFGQSYLGITTQNVNFREGPGEEYSVLKKLQSGTQLFLYSIEPENEFYFVIEIESNEEGFVHKKFVKILQDIKRNEEGIFSPIEQTNSYNPKVEIYNNTTRILTLKLNDIRYKFQPKEKRTLDLSPGIYDYYASASLVIPDYGTEKLVSNYSYYWEFYIVSGYGKGYRKKRK